MPNFPGKAVLLFCGQVSPFLQETPQISHRKTAHRHSNSTTEAIAAITTVMATAGPGI